MTTPLTPDEAKSAARRQYEADPQGLIAAYRERFGNVFNADNASELIDVYNASPENRATFHAAIHDTTRRIRDDAFRAALRDPENVGKPVVFTAGGTASGKSTSAATLGRKGLVYDTTFSSLEGSRKMIDEVLATGRQVGVVYTYRDPVDAFQGMLLRATDPEQGGRKNSFHPEPHEDASWRCQNLCGTGEAVPRKPKRSVSGAAVSRAGEYPGADPRRVGSDAGVFWT